MIIKIIADQKVCCDVLLVDKMTRLRTNWSHTDVQKIQRCPTAVPSLLTLNNQKRRRDALPHILYHHIDHSMWKNTVSDHFRSTQKNIASHLTSPRTASFDVWSSKVPGTPPLICRYPRCLLATCFFFRIIKHQPSTTPGPQLFFGEASVNKLSFLFCFGFFLLLPVLRGDRQTLISVSLKGLNCPVTLIEGHREQKNEANVQQWSDWNVRDDSARRRKAPAKKSESSQGTARIPLWMADLIVIHSEIWRKSVILSCQSIPAIRPALHQPSEIYHRSRDERRIWSFLWCPHQSGPCLQVMMYSVWY